MPTIVTVMDIEAPPEAVAAVLLDAEAAPLWTSGLERLELIEGVAGEPGSVGLAHYLEGGRRYTLRDRLLEVTPNHHYLSEIAGGGMRATVETTLERVASGTQMTVTWTGRGTNPLSGISLPLMRRRIARLSRVDLAALRDLVQSRAGSPDS